MQKTSKLAKDQLVQFRLTTSDIESIKEAARREHLPLASYARSVLMREALEVTQGALTSGAFSHGTYVIPRERGYLPMSVAVPVSPGATIQIKSRPQVPFRADRLAIDVDSIGFIIEEIAVARRSVGVQAGPIPTSPFAAQLDKLRKVDAELMSQDIVKISIENKETLDGIGQALEFPLCPAGSEVILTATNRARKAAQFYAVLFGTIM